MKVVAEIDDINMKLALELSGLKTEEQVLNAALKVFADRLRRRNMLDLKGKEAWEGDLEEMRKQI